MEDVAWSDIPESVLNELYQSIEVSADSDLSHNPDKLPQLFESANTTQPTDLPPQEETLSQLFNRIAIFLEEFSNHLRGYQETLQNIISNLDKHLANQHELIIPLQEQFAKDMTINQSAMQELGQAHKLYLLTPPQIHKVYQSRLSLYNQELIIQFFQSEVSSLLRREPLKERLLIIKQQPLPHVVFKTKSMEDRYAVELITSLPDSLKQSQKDSSVIASVYTENNTPMKGKAVLSQNTGNMSSERIAIFPQLKAELSTRMSIVHLHFELKNKANVTLASSTYNSRIHSSFIVITNESQWCEAQGKLITQHCFTNPNEQISWNEYANMIHHHFLKTSRQDLMNFSRCILPHEFEYIRHKYFNQTVFVSLHQSNTFWNWLGPVACALRFKRHINTLWFHGLIYGLISKRDCEMVLAQQRIGTFIIRFSESYPGFFGVSYVAGTPSGGTCVMHYLVDHQDIGSQKTLPDFLRSKDQFQYIAQLTPNTGQLMCYEKDVALNPYYAKGKATGGKKDGYSDLAPVYG